MNALEILHFTLHLQGIQLARTHDLKPYIIFIKPPSIGCMRQTRKNARIITDYYVNMKFKVRFVKKKIEFINLKFCYWIIMHSTMLHYYCFLRINSNYSFSVGLDFDGISFPLPDWF